MMEEQEKIKVIFLFGKDTLNKFVMDTAIDKENIMDNLATLAMVSLLGMNNEEFNTIDMDKVQEEDLKRAALMIFNVVRSQDLVKKGDEYLRNIFCK